MKLQAGYNTFLNKDDNKCTYSLEHLRDITKKRGLGDILALIPKLSLTNGRWKTVTEPTPEQKPGEGVL